MEEIFENLFNNINTVINKDKRKSNKQYTKHHHNLEIKKEKIINNIIKRNEITTCFLYENIEKYENLIIYIENEYMNNNGYGPTNRITEEVKEKYKDDVNYINSENFSKFYERYKGIVTTMNLMVPFLASTDYFKNVTYDNLYVKNFEEEDNEYEEYLTERNEELDYLKNEESDDNELWKYQINDSIYSFQIDIENN